MQGENTFPVMFNFLVDTVIRTWKRYGSQQRSSALFYANDGLIGHIDAVLKEERTPYINWRDNITHADGCM